MFETIVDFIKEKFAGKQVIQLHEPVFDDLEKELLIRCVESTFVSSVGEYVDRFEDEICKYTGASHAVAVVNGTAGLHIALHLLGVHPGDLVLTQPVTFIATANAVSYCGAKPVFIDIDADTLGMSPEALRSFLHEQCIIDDSGVCIHKTNRQRIAACLPVHVLGIPARIDEIVSICDEFNIPVVEDAAEALGSYYGERHTGRFGKIGIFSFNGNKIITTGGGGMLVTDDKDIAKKAKHLTTTARVPHRWEYIHDEIGFNYRMPNINAALGCAQIKKLDSFLLSKRRLASEYQTFFEDTKLVFVKEPPGAVSNYWLNAVLFEDQQDRDAFLTYAIERGVMVRPLWRLINEQQIYSDSLAAPLPNAEFISKRLVCLPSSVIQ